MKSFNLFLLIILSTHLIGCGRSISLIKNIQVSVHQDGQKNEIVDMTADVNLGNLRFPSVTLPIVNPHDLTKQYGTLSLQTSPTGQNILLVESNLSSIAKDKLNNDGLLPNGQPIPVGGLDVVYGLKAGSKSKVYIGYSKDNWMLGVAVAIREFDQIARYVPGVDLFFPITANGVNGLAGVFTGNQPETSGIGIFAEIPQKKFDVTVASKALAARPSSLQFLSIQPSSQQTRLLENQLWMMSRQSKTLQAK